MAFLKNLRGAKTYPPPATNEYGDNYDRIFGAKGLPGELDHLPIVALTWPCKRCGFVPPDGDYPSCNVDSAGQVTDCDRCEARAQ